MKRKTLLIGALVIFVLMVISSNSGEAVIMFLFLGGLWGIFAIAQKGYITGVSIVLWLLLGWWFILVLLFAGPFTLLLAAMLPERKRCSHCREFISNDATRCPKCMGDLAVTAEKYRI